MPLESLFARSFSEAFVRIGNPIKPPPDTRRKKDVPGV